IVDVLYGLQKCQCENDGLHRSKPQSTSQETTCESLLRGQHILQELTRHRSCISRDLLGSAGRDDEPASFPAFRPEIDQPIRRFDDVTVVLDNHHGSTRFDQTFESDKELVDIVEV